jgi:hypothetical protein
MIEPTEIRGQLDAELDRRRERLRRIDDMALAALVEHLRSLVPDPQFDPVLFLADWLWGRVPSLGWVTPMDLLEREGGIDRLKEHLGQLVAGVYV